MKPAAVVMIGAALTAVAFSLPGSPFLGLVGAALDSGTSHVTVSVQQEACESRHRGDMERACEVREVTFASPRDGLIVDGGQNGGIKVYGESRRDVRLVAEVWATARSADRAEELMDAVRIETDGGRIESDGPQTGRRESWGVNWRVFVPHQSDLDLRTHNGGIGISDVDGAVRFEALNGGVKLDGMAGDVRGSTVNGGVQVDLEGDRWDGAGLNVTTTNGGIQLEMAEDYSAELETGTVNGRLSTEIAMQVSGRIGKRLRTQLGDGGPPIHVSTVNGGVEIRGN